MRWGCLLPRCLAAWRPTRCAPRCGTRALDRRLPVLDESAIGGFGLRGEFLVEPVLLPRDEDADPLPLLVLRAGHQLEPAQLLAGERRAGEGVVLAAAEHVPGDHGELAGDRDGGDVAAAPDGDPLMEGAQRPGVRVACQAASTSMCRVSPGPCLEMRPCRAGSVPDCCTRGSSPR
jgi:hypothetical protein